MGLEDERALNILVRDIMNDKPVCVDKTINIAILSEMMSKKNVEAVVVLDNDKPIGIITEKDLLIKVLAKKKRPEDTKAEEIMSTPLITIHPSSDIMTAIKMMLTYNIRRLIVAEEDKVVGILTVSDLLRITPSLIDLMQEKTLFNLREEGKISGYCDACGEWSDDLTLVDGQYLCENCRG